MNYLITGGAGFIGSHFVDYLLDFDELAQVIILDKLTYAANVNNLANAFESNRVQFIQGDISDFELVSNLISTSNVVVNFAAETHVDRSIKDSSLFVLSNVVGVEVLLRAISQHTEKLFIQISTDEVYGSLPEVDADEEFPLLPNSPYAASKAAADLICRSFFKTHNLDIRITRCSNNYGTRQFPEKFIPLVLRKIKENQSVPVYGNGMNIREWIHVKDHCSGILKVIQHGKPGEIYNIGSNIKVSNLDLVKKILLLSKKDESFIDFVEDRLGHDFRYSLNSSKIRTKLGFENVHDFDTGIGELIALTLQ